MLNHKLVKIPRNNLNPTILSLPFQVQPDLKFPKLSKLTSKTPRLDLNQTQIIELPEISRYNTPSPKKFMPSLKNFSTDSPERQLVNLERIIQQEHTLSSIVDKLGSDEICDFSKSLQDYWEISNNEALWGIEKLFKSAATRKSLLTSQILESLSLVLLMHCNDKRLVYTHINKQLRNLGYYLHQSLLTVIDLVLSRLPAEVEGSAWVTALINLVQDKKLKCLKRTEHSNPLKQYCDIISNCIRTAIHLSASTNGLSVILHILSNLDKYSIKAVRSYLLPMKNQSEAIASPFLTSPATKKITLVLDLDETLVHYSGHKKSGELLIRPYCSEFLEAVNEFYEIVVFTAGIQEVINR